MEVPSETATPDTGVLLWTTVLHTFHGRSSLDRGHSWQLMLDQALAYLGRTESTRGPQDCFPGLLAEESSQPVHATHHGAHLTMGPNASLWRLGFQHMNWGEGTHWGFNI